MNKKEVIPIVLIVLIVSAVFTYAYYLEEDISLRQSPLPDNVVVYSYGPAGLVSKQQGSEVSYYHKDHLGSSSLVSDSEGEITYSSDYYPFGESYNEEGEERYTYTGKEKDSSGLYYYGARYYDASLGRFISVDPVKDLLFSSYVYVRDNPMKYVDPSGRQEESIEDLLTIKEEEYDREDIEVVIGDMIKLGKSGGTIWSGKKSGENVYEKKYLSYRVRRPIYVKYVDNDNNRILSEGDILYVSGEYFEGSPNYVGPYSYILHGEGKIWIEKVTKYNFEIENNVYGAFMEIAEDLSDSLLNAIALQAFEDLEIKRKNAENFRFEAVDALESLYGMYRYQKEAESGFPHVKDERKKERYIEDYKRVKERYGVQ